MPTKDHEKLLSVLDEIVEGLASQQAMTDESWRNSYRELREKLSAALATPDTLPPVAVGDYVDLDVFGLCYVPTKEAARVLSGGSDGLKAVYHRVWQRGKD